MRELIKGQTIRFDAHDSGSGREVSWDNSSVHLHKIMNEHKYKGVEVLIPLNEDKELEFRKSYNGDIERRIRNEISDVLNKDTQKRKELIRTLFKQIERYSHNEPSEKRIKNLIDGANRIAKHFDLKKHFEKEIFDNLNQCLTKHYDKKNKVCFVLQDLREEVIKLGENKALLFEENLFPKIKY